MAHTIKAFKRVRQSGRRHSRNRARKAEIRVRTRMVRESLAGKNAAEARKQFALATKAIDKAVARGTIHANAGARRKAALARQLAAAK